MPQLENGERIPTINANDSLQIINYIAEGGQGEVYKVNYNGRTCALKWYKSQVPPDYFYENLKRMVQRGAPNDNFLWPQMLTNRYKDSYGYVMELRPSNYCEFGDFLLDNVRFKSYKTLIDAALNIVGSFRELHSMGYSYQDVNEGGFFIDPKTGAVLICDNDNVAEFGVNLGVKGMPRYMAPEVVTNQTRPNTHTDRFSLAVLLFRLFYIDHPLEGKYTVQFPLTDAIGAQLYGVDPTFIYDPKKNKNRPDPEAHPNVIKRWKMYPPDLKATFMKAFTKGMKDINNRVTEVEWEEALVKTRGMLVKIDGKEQFINAYAKQKLPEGCQMMVLPDYVVVLTNDTEIYDCHVDQFSADYHKVAGVVKASLSDKTVLGLGNLSDKDWTVTSPSGDHNVITKGQYTRIAPGVKIDFGGTTAEIY